MSHSQPFANTYFHFLILSESATAHTFLQRPKQMTVRSGMPEWGGWSRRSTYCVQLALCRGCTDVLKSHPSRHISSLFLGNASHSRQTCRSMCSSCFAPRHDISVDGSYCITEQRETSNYWTPGKDALQPVGFELSCGAHTSHRQSQWISATHFLPSDILVPRAHTPRYPSSSWTVFAKNSERQLQCHRQISNCESSVFQNQFLNSCYVDTRHWCVTPTACPVDHFRTLCTTFQYNALSLRHHSTQPSGEQVSPIKSYSHYEILRGAKFPVLSLRINLSPEQTLTLTSSFTCYL
jgi:hypothetical protein